ncbi:nitroreductase family protein [Nocardiopsis metallicus]|uniref:Nitroreductase n=1 Tax=Nocardiopsis metallicus TaxID=179819 RepID=A0A840WWD7_9ACTN|nr:nitroreductase family protein [Nocardiopsis metallicus]MBB5494478.1 nitroreductase [Nocardiopsis metallicus]
MAPPTVAEAIRHRRSVRRFRPDPVPETLLHELLELTMEAPSSWNFQSRSVVAVRDPVAREALSRAAYGQRQPREAPLTLVFLAETGRWHEDLSGIYRAARDNRAWDEDFVHATATSGIDFQRALDARGLGREYAVKDAVIAATHAMLAASAAGLASSPMNGWDEAQVLGAIGADHRDGLAVALLLSVGYPAEQHRHPGRLPLHRVAFGDRYGESL